jgi:hypothetical protein
MAQSLASRASIPISRSNRGISIFAPEPPRKPRPKVQPYVPVVPVLTAKGSNHD